MVTITLNNGIDLAQRPFLRGRRLDPLLLSVPAALFVLLGELTFVRSDDSVTGRPLNNQQRARWFEFYREQAGSMTVGLEATDSGSVKMEAEPLLLYSNPVRGQDMHGTLWLWTDDAGRPVMIGAFWSVIADATQRKLSLEWHSLVDTSIVVRYRDKDWWKSGEPGLEWRRCDGVDPPAASRVLRLTQMRAIARQVQAEIESQESELRLMSQPIFRYSESNTSRTDGALFALGMGTDPEVIVLVEARTSQAGMQEWWIAAAHFAREGVDLKWNGAQLLTTGTAAARLTTGRHHLHFGVELYPEDLTGVPAKTVGTSEGSGQ